MRGIRVIGGTDLRLVGYAGKRRIDADLVVDWIKGHLRISCYYGKYECSMDEYNAFEGNMDEFIRHHVLKLKARH